MKAEKRTIKRMNNEMNNEMNNTIKENKFKLRAFFRTLWSIFTSSMSQDLPLDFQLAGLCSVFNKSFSVFPCVL